jgi:hypothetical protein
MILIFNASLQKAETLKKLAVKTGAADPALALGTHEALYDFEPQNDGDLALLAGDSILLQEDYGDGWCKGAGQSGAESILTDALLTPTQASTSEPSAPASFQRIM